MTGKASESPGQTLATRLLRNRWYLKVIHQPQQNDDIEQILKKRIMIFPTNSAMRQKSSQLGMGGRLFVHIAAVFAKEALRGRVPRCNTNKILPSSDVNATVASIDQTILSSFYEFAEPRLPSHIQKRFNELRKAGDLYLSSQSYPKVRKLDRRIMLHIGIPNAKKVQTIMKYLSESNSGIYCGATSQTARTIFEQIKKKGEDCRLDIGTERHVTSSNPPPFTSTTVEEASLANTVELAVVDEVQRIGDTRHGWAWTRLLLGLPARELHLFGDVSVVPLIQRICEALKEPLYIKQHRYDIPIKVASTSLDRDWRNTKKQDCIMAHSRREAFFIKEEIERKTSLRCTVVYDNLPIEIQAAQVSAFNRPNSGVDVLIISNASIMDMDIRIRRLVFSSTVKRLYQSKLPSVILQKMASQAGKYGRFDPLSSVTMLSKADMPFVKHIYTAPTVMIKYAGLRPDVDALRILDHHLPGIAFSELLQRFEDMATTHENYFLCDLGHLKAVANFIQHIDMPLHDRYQFVTCPITPGDTMSVEAIQKMAKALGEKKTCTLDRIMQLPETPPNSLKGLNELESTHRVILLYMWFSIRYPNIFVTASSTTAQIKQQCEHLFSETLQHHLRTIAQEMKPAIRVSNQDKDRLLLEVLEMINQREELPPRDKNTTSYRR